MNARFSERHALICHNFDKDQSDTMTNVSSTAWVDMRYWGRITALCFRAAGTGSVQEAGLYVSAASTGTTASLIGSLHGSNAATDLASAAAGTNSERDCRLIILEASYDEIAAALSGGRYVSARLSLATGTDEFYILYILSEPRYGSATGMTSGAG